MITQKHQGKTFVNYFTMALLLIQSVILRVLVFSNFFLDLPGFQQAKYTAYLKSHGMHAFVKG